MRAAMEVNADSNFWLGHGAPAGSLGVIAGYRAPARHTDLIKKDLNPIDSKSFNAGAPDSGEYPSPIRVAGEKGCFDQWRMGDGEGGLPRFLAACGTAHIDRNKFGCALAIAHDGLSQVNHDFGQDSLKSCMSLA